MGVMLLVSPRAAEDADEAEDIAPGATDADRWWIGAGAGVMDRRSRSREGVVALAAVVWFEAAAEAEADEDERPGTTVAER